MKKVLLLALALIMVFAVAGCSEPVQKSNDVHQYVTKDAPKLLSAVEEYRISYKSVIGDNYTDDETMYEEFKENTLPLIDNAKIMGDEVLNKIQDPEVIAVHTIYINAVFEHLSAVTNVIKAVEDGNGYIVSVANRSIKESQKQIEKYEEALKKLAKENDIIME